MHKLDTLHYTVTTDFQRNTIFLLCCSAENCNITMFECSLDEQEFDVIIQIFYQTPEFLTKFEL